MPKALKELFRGQGIGLNPTNDDRVARVPRVADSKSATCALSESWGPGDLWLSQGGGLKWVVNGAPLSAVKGAPSRPRPANNTVALCHPPPPPPAPLHRSAVV